MSVQQTGAIHDFLVLDFSASGSMRKTMRNDFEVYDHPECDLTWEWTL